jgi:FkbM family methyltransferase
MLDIGASIGRMSIPRVILGDLVHAYCAEPDPLNYAALVRNVAANGLCGLVLPDQAAIGAATGPRASSKASIRAASGWSEPIAPSRRRSTCRASRWTIGAGGCQSILSWSTT